MLRFETIPRAPGIGEGLAARVHDPLWLLARQWQFGEFRSENAASAAWVDVEVDVHLLDRWRPGPPAAGLGELPFDRTGRPLERLVEEEPEHEPSPRLRLEGGLRLKRLLAAAGLGDRLPVFVAACPFDRVVRDRAPVPQPGTVAAALRRALPDGALLAPQLMSFADPAASTPLMERLGDAVDAVRPVAVEWLAWWRARVPEESPVEPAPVHPPTWDRHRLEYAFGTHASSLPEVRLEGAGHGGGRLDWWAVDAAPPAGPPGLGVRPLQITLRAVPAPAQFGGMPAPRFWEMEDARFDPGAVDAAPIDLGRLLLASFATVYGNDWYVLPLRLPPASLSRVTRFLVTDVFGGKRLIGAAGAAQDNWSLFALTDASALPSPGEERPTSEWFYLAAAMPDGLEGPAAERVLLLRDEMANLAWAVESHVADDAGAIVDRFAEPQEPLPGGEGGEDAGAADAPAVPRYEVESPVPRNWYPLAPEQLPDQTSVRLRLVPVARGADPATRRLELPLGRLLADAAPLADGLWLHEEEVPRAGAAVARVPQHARWHDGSAHAWTGRAKRTGGGEGSSGLRFDFLAPPGDGAGP
jgi:hypothetical protein